MDLSLDYYLVECIKVSADNSLHPGTINIMYDNYKFVQITSCIVRNVFFFLTSQKYVINM